MFKLLVSLFIVFNIIAIIIILLTIICAFIANIRKTKYVKSEILLPGFLDCKKTFIQCCISSSIFSIVAWVLYAPQAITETWNGIEFLAKCLFSFGIIWAVILIISIISEIVLGFFKNKCMSLKDSFFPLFLRSIWCFILAFVMI